MDKVLYMLIGPKGSGKTTVGILVDQETDITFINVEPIWQRLQPGEDGWREVESVIDALFQRHDKLMIESLGAGEGFRRFHSSLAQKYTIKMIRIYADLDICFARIKSRNSQKHVMVSDEQVLEYNTIAANVTYDWDLEIDNNAPNLNADIIAMIRAI